MCWESFLICLIVLKGMLLVLWQLGLGVKNRLAVVCQELNDKRLRFGVQLTVFLFPPLLRGILESNSNMAASEAKLDPSVWGNVIFNSIPCSLR